VGRASRIQLWSVVGLFIGLAFLSGCGKGKSTKKEIKGVPVAGQLLQNGKVIKLKPDETVQISFVLDAEVGAAAEYKVDDGTFVIKGPTEEGIPPGQYKIELGTTFYGGGDGTNRFEKDSESEKAPPAPLVADVSAEEGQYFIVDVGTRKVTKKKK
jgi:hypothetical protein